MILLRSPRPPWPSMLGAAVALLTAAVSPRAQPVVRSIVPVAPYPGLHLAVPLAGAPQLAALDLNGGVAHVWNTPSPGWVFAEMAKPLAGGHVLTSLRDPSNGARKLVELDWAGQVLWQYDPTPLGRTIHHEFSRLPGGNTLVVARVRDSSRSVVARTIWDELITEVDPSGATVWEWSAAAHARQMPITQAGWNSLLPAEGVATLFHLNSAAPLPPNPWAASDVRFRPGNVLASFRELNLVVIIDKSTGDIVWTLHDKTIGQHHPRMIAGDLPGNGNVLLLDNGGSAGAPRLPVRTYSRVLEFDPTTLEIVWQYGGVPWQPLYSPFMGSVQRLPSGNTLVHEATTGRSFEVSPASRVVWERRGGDSYRAYRVPLDWRTAGRLPFPW